MGLESVYARSYVFLKGIRFMTQVTLVYLVRMEGGIPTHVYLGEKKSKYVAGYLNTAGGKVDPGEAIDASAAREILGEWKVRVLPEHLRLIAQIHFLFPSRPQQNLECHVFCTDRWEGEPQETREMKKPDLFPVTALPLDRLPPGDRHWLPKIFGGQFVEMSLELNEDFTPIRVVSESLSPLTA